MSFLDGRLDKKPSCQGTRDALKKHVQSHAPRNSWVFVHSHSAQVCHPDGCGSRLRWFLPEFEFMREHGLKIAMMGNAPFKVTQCPTDIRQTTECFGTHVSGRRQEILREHMAEKKLIDMYIDPLPCLGAGKDLYAMKLWGGLDLYSDDHHLSQVGGLITLPCVFDAFNLIRHEYKMANI